MILQKKRMIIILKNLQHNLFQYKIENRRTGVKRCFLVKMKIGTLLRWTLEYLLRITKRKKKTPDNNFLGKQERNVAYLFALK